ncbi:MULTISPECIES: hypothetical protein [Bacillaceae]|uniref:Uncharacterized protein n=1 Tax=Evansella alkalicola TaxID=745819 RepID=A0ABS6JVH9_9BACI|nr:MULTISPECIES: hypothetical protein [Bacillaceae]MBU9721694.1 hypothetical protein [Bacillus alkalicola]
MPAKKSVRLKNPMNLPKFELDNNMKEKLNTILEDKKMISLVKKLMSNQTQGMRLMKDFSEIIALRLNLPTKDDVANIAKLNIQIEEKIDSLEEKFSILADRLQDSPEVPNQTAEMDELTEDATQDSTTSNTTSVERKQMILNDLLKQLQRDSMLKSANLHEVELSDMTKSIIRKVNNIER